LLILFLLIILTLGEQAMHRWKLGSIIVLVSIGWTLCADDRADASIINSSNVVINAQTYTTFQDTTTSLTWLKLDNFWNHTDTYNSVVATLTGSNFHLATLSDLSALQASIPAIPANFTAESIISGGNYIAGGGNPLSPANRDLMWGIYEDGNPSNGVSYSWKYGSDISWQFGPNSVSASQLLYTANSFNQDLGAWVVSNSVLTVTPEPSSLVLLGTAVSVGLVWRRRRQRNGVSRTAA